MILPVNHMLVLTCVRASSYVSFTRRTYFSGTPCSRKHLQTSCRGTVSYAFSRSINTRCSAFCISRCFSITCLAANIASVVYISCPLLGISCIYQLAFARHETGLLFSCCLFPQSSVEYSFPYLNGMISS